MKNAVLSIYCLMMGLYWAVAFTLNSPLPEWVTCRVTVYLKSGPAP